MSDSVCSLFVCSPAPQETVRPPLSLLHSHFSVSPHLCHSPLLSLSTSISPLLSLSPCAYMFPRSPCANSLTFAMHSVLPLGAYSCTPEHTSIARTHKVRERETVLSFSHAEIHRGVCTNKKDRGKLTQVHRESTHKQGSHKKTNQRTPNIPDKMNEI